MCKRKDNGVTLHFVEVYFDGIWTPVGAGHSTRQEADWSISCWRQNMDCRRDAAFRVREHAMTAPPEDEMVGEMGTCDPADFGKEKSA